MKRFTLLLMPVMPGFDAWAANGFVETTDDSETSERKPIPVDSPALAKLVDGFTTPAGETVFIEYGKLGKFIHAFCEKSLNTTIQPLDRGGLLFSCAPDKALWTSILRTVNVPLDELAKTVSKSK